MVSGKKEEADKRTRSEEEPPESESPKHQETDARSIESIVRESEMMAAILSSLKTGLVVINPDRTIDWVNEETRRMFPEGDPAGKVCHEFFESSKEPCETCAARKAFETGQPSQVDRYNDVTKRYYRIVSQPIKDDAGRVVKVIDSVTDITERRLAQDALKESEESYRLMFDKMLSGFALHEIIVDDSGKPCDYRFLDVNPAFEKLTGLKGNDIVGKTVLEVLPGTEPYRIENFGEVALTGEPAHIEYYSRELDKYFEAYAYSPQKGRFAVTFNDVTERRGAQEISRKAREELETNVEERTAELLKATELLRLEIEERKRVAEELRVSEERFSKAFHSSPSIMSISTLKDGRFIGVNESFKRIIGHSREEAIGSTSTELGIFNPEERRRIVSLLDESGSIRNHEIVYRAKSGRVRMGSFSAQVIYLEGEPCLLTVVEDITERKRAEEALRESEEKFRTLAEFSPIAISILRGNRILYVNSVWEALTGYSREEAQTLDPLMAVHPDMRPLVKERVAARMRGEQVVPRYEMKGITKSGEVKWYDLSATVIDYDGEPAILAAASDITDRKLLEEQLRHAHKIQAVGTLAGGIAHEFNNLLQGVLGYADLLIMGKAEDDPEVGELKEIVRAAKRGSELTSKMLAFSEGLEGEPRPLDLASEMPRTLRHLQRAMPHNIDVKFQISSDLRPVSADPAHMEQLFMNLALNARDAMPDGGEIVIEIENVTLDEEYCNSHLEARPGDYVFLGISDNGHGIDRETMERIFEPFFSTRETGKGTGLGLAVVHGIVESHGGHIECLSEPSEGTTFKIYLPALEPGELDQHESAGHPLEGGEETILVVDDEEAIKDLGERMLARFGYRVLTALDGETALEIYREKMHEIDLVILDLIMPGMGGMRCLEELLRINPGVKVLVASGHSSEGPVEESLEAGAKGFIGKPYELGVMLDRVRELLDGD